MAVSGMTCAACVSRIEKVLTKRPGVVSATVSLPAERADIVFDPDRVEVAELIGVIENAGFGARPMAGDAASTTGEEAARDARSALISLAVSAVLTLPLAVGMLAMMVDLPSPVPGWAQLALATPVQFWAGARFYRGAWHALKGGGANMDVLITLGTSAAYFLSLWLVLRGSGDHGHGNGHQTLYFEASGIVITLVLAGKWLEARARRATNRAIDALLALRPDTARRLLADGREEVVPVDQIRPGEVVGVRPGERLPVDGVIIAGHAAIDESMVTGESLPRERNPDDPVVGGTINLDGYLKVRATATGAEAVLGRMIALVGHAQASKPRIQRLADIVSGWFAFFVAGVAIVTFFGWLITGHDLEHSILPAVAVLVVACPCALGLATPAVIAVALGAAARHGILIRDAEALETAYRIGAVVFDKTGTLTENRPELTEAIALDGKRNDLITLAALIQRSSSHPIARAVLSFARDHHLERTGEVTGFRVLAGRGVQGLVGERMLAIGNRTLMGEQGVATTQLQERAAELEARGQAIAWLAELAPEPRLLGLIAIADRVRPSAAEALARLRRLGIEAVMLTGDAPGAARAVANRIGVKRVVSEAHPEDKIDEIARLQEQGVVVAMVGDGVNDAPALAKADLGIAMGGGTDVAVQAAAVGLMRDDPALVPAVILLARITRRRIVQNLVWAFAFNAVAIPLAAFGALGPVVAATGMTFSSLAVVGNALRLQRWRPDGV